MNSSVSISPGQDILIVDDTISNVRMLSEMLAKANFSVRKAINGSMALMAVQARSPDLILLDINMPMMDGYAVCDHLKKNPATQDIPIIFLSASSALDDKVKAFQLGGADYITKPFQAEEVIARIQNQITLKQLRLQLETKNKDLERTLAQLKATQAELIQKQKMLGLGQLVAGIAHEVNNPISFIACNVEHAKDYYFHLVNILQLYQQHYPQPVEAISEAIAAADLDFLLTDFPNLLQSMKTGSVRICELVEALKTFSHHGELTVKTIDLHTIINSILVLLKPRLQKQAHRPDIQFHCDYSTKLPPIKCDVKLISQALFNLIENAIDAIDSLWSNTEAYGNSDPCFLQQPAIWIITDFTQDERVSVTIRDNGIGIPDDVRPYIYNPFFTTKTVGQGQGLGLYISYQIVVSQHQGNLSFTSMPLKGSEFVMEIPLGIMA